MGVTGGVVEVVGFYLVSFLLYVDAVWLFLCDLAVGALLVLLLIILLGCCVPYFGFLS